MAESPPLAPVRFLPLWNSNSPVRPLVSADGRYIVLEVFAAESASYSGFRVYDTREGELLEEDYLDLGAAKQAVQARLADAA